MEQQDMHEDHAEGTVATPPAAAKKNSSFAKQFVAGLVVVIVVAVLGVYLYTKSQMQQLSDAPFVLSVAEAFNMPIGKINGHTIPYTEFMTDYSSLTQFYAQQDASAAPLTSDEIAQQVLSRLLVNEMIMDLADKYDIEPTDSEIQAARSELFSQFPDEATAASEIQSTFGWSLDTFTDRVIVPLVLEQKVSAAFEADTSVDTTYTAEQVHPYHILFTYDTEDEKAAVKKKAEGVLDRIKNGEDFGELAKEYGSDGTAEVGGDLGWVDHGVTVPAFEDAIFSLDAGELSPELVETEFGFHIVKVEEKREVNDFAAYFQQALSDANIKIYADVANPFSPENIPTSETAPVPTTDESAMMTDTTDTAE